MGRIRTIKPEMARHEGLFDLEQETGLPMRFAWAMLPTACDREGRFDWRPRTLKAEILPHDTIDFSRVLDAWLTRGFVVRYRVRDAWYGWLPTFAKHQIVNHRELKSTRPSFEDAEESQDFRNQQVRRVEDASGTREAPVQGMPGGKGKEGKGREGEGIDQDHPHSAKSAERVLLEARFETFWDAYPRKDSRKDAFKAFSRIKLTPEVFAAILDAVRRQKLSEQWSQPRFIPHASTWLNQERWTDSSVPAAAVPAAPVYQDLRAYERKRQADVEAGGGLVTIEQMDELRTKLRVASK